jgi:hypothetical protein
MAVSNDKRLVPTGKRNSAVARVAIVGAILSLVALAALAAPQYQNRERDRDRDHDRGRDRGFERAILILSYDRVARDFGGGSGGRPAPDALCEPGFVAVGFHVQTGEYYNQAWLDCAPMRSDGSLGEERRITARTGSPGGRPVSDASCSNGLALRGLRGRTGASIDEAIGECSLVRDIARRYDNPRTEFTQSVMRPRPGGRPAEGQCPAGSVVTGFRSMSGEYMDHLWLVCSELKRSY